MSDFPVIEGPEFNKTMRMLETTDPAHANLFNRMFAILLENDVFLYDGMVKKTIKYEKILNASEWTGSTPPYKYNLMVPEATASNNIEVIPTGVPTTEQYESMIMAGIFAGEQSTGMVSLFAYSEKPTINLPITVLVRGDS